jgi:2-phospho-L-lactate guanylyltransferase
MSAVAIVPINMLRLAKSRLRDVLSATDRQALVLWMAARVLEAIARSAAVSATAVVSPDPVVLMWAQRHGADPLEQVDIGLNEGLEIGRRWALCVRADTLLVLHADLPCIAAPDISELVRAVPSDDVRAGVALAPDRAGRGTNGLVLHPTALMPFAFGTNSLYEHMRLARDAGVEPVLRWADGTCFDVDTAADLEVLQDAGVWTPDGSTAPARAKGERA